MEFKENDARNLLYLSSREEWKSFSRYLDVLEQRALNTLKTSQNEHAIYNAQGEMRIIDNLKSIREKMRMQVEGSKHG